MEILVIGNEANLAECSQKFGHEHVYRIGQSHAEAGRILKSELVVFDFKINEDVTATRIYNNFDGIAFVDVSRNSLKQLINPLETKASIFGFCGMPTFLDREVLEVSFHKTELEKLKDVCEKFKTKFVTVEDQVGLITPRVICMIINEAYFAIQENIASRNDIDLAMKLGTNYPFGPFEWCEKIGVKNVCELLSAVYESTKDERYRVCELLEKEASKVTG